MSKKDEYWNDYGAHERQKAMGKMRGAAGAVTGAAIGSAIAPGPGTTIGAIVGYVAGVVSAHKERVENGGRCPSNSDLVKEAGRTASTLHKYREK